MPIAIELIICTSICICQACCLTLCTWLLFIFFFLKKSLLSSFMQTAVTTRTRKKSFESSNYYISNQFPYHRARPSEYISMVRFITCKFFEMLSLNLQFEARPISFVPVTKLQSSYGIPGHLHSRCRTGNYY